MAKQRFAGTWGHGCLGLLWRHKYEVVGSSNRSILYLGKQAESYKVMIYAPPCLEIDGAEGVVDRSLATSPRVSAGAHKKEILERQSTEMKLLLRSNHSRQGSRGQHETRHYDTDLPSRAVTNRLSEVPVTHEDTPRLTRFKLFSYTAD